MPDYPRVFNLEQPPYPGTRAVVMYVQPEVRAGINALAAVESPLRDPLRRATSTDFRLVVAAIEFLNRANPIDVDEFRDSRLGVNDMQLANLRHWVRELDLHSIFPYRAAWTLPFVGIELNDDQWLLLVSGVRAYKAQLIKTDAADYDQLWMVISAVADVLPAKIAEVPDRPLLGADLDNEEWATRPWLAAIRWLAGQVEL